MEKQIEVFYTGGGIWLSEMNLGNGTYAVVDSEFKDCIAIYKYTDNEDEKYMMEDMIYTENVENMDSEHKKIYDQLLKALNEKSY